MLMHLKIHLPIYPIWSLVGNLLSSAEDTTVLGTETPVLTKATAIMRKTQPRESLLYNVRSWAEEISLGSLDQLQHAAGRSHLLREDADNPASIPLPTSRESSLRDTGSEDLRWAPTTGHFAPDDRSQLHADILEALDVPLHVSRLGTADAPNVALPESSGLGNSIVNSGPTSTVDSFARLQAARLPGPEQLHQSATAEALTALLPQSSGLGGDHCTSGPISTVDSLAQLLKATLLTPAERPADQPTERPTLGSVRQTYWEKIRPITRILPHLKAIEPSNGTNQRVGRLKSIDCFNNGTAPQVGISFKMGAPLDQDRLVTGLQELKHNRDGTVASRMVVVEDLCSELIEALGFAFDLDPEFFAEHLNRSGYNSADYEDAPPERWRTAHLQKDYASMTWMRPDYQSVTVEELLQTPGTILDRRKESPKALTATAKGAAIWQDAELNDKGERNEQAMKHNSSVDTNIFRQSRLLSTRSVLRSEFQDVQGAAQPWNNASTSSNFVPAAWEERVSFCYQEDNTEIPIGMCQFNPAMFKLITKNITKL
jgi:hypothetical protein